MALRDEKVDTVTQLLERYDVSTLAAAQRPWGQRMQKVGPRLAESVMAHARARITGEVQHLSPPQFPESPNYLVFDIEGMPAYLDDDEQAYLWGIQLYGEDGGDFTPALAGFHEGGDREGWFEFLDNCQIVFAAHGDLPILHWGSYEKTKINQYLDRYGDKKGTTECRIPLYPAFRSRKRHLSSSVRWLYLVPMAAPDIVGVALGL